MRSQPRNCMPVRRRSPFAAVPAGMSAGAGPALSCRVGCCPQSASFEALIVTTKHARKHFCGALPYLLYSVTRVPTWPGVQGQRLPQELEIGAEAQAERAVAQAMGTSACLHETFCARAARERGLQHKVGRPCPGPTGHGDRPLRTRRQCPDAVLWLSGPGSAGCRPTCLGRRALFAVRPLHAAAAAAQPRHAGLRLALPKS